MSLKEKIKQDLNFFLKEKKTLEVSVLRQILATILNKEKEKKYKLKQEDNAILTQEELIEVVSFEAKKRRESIECFEKGERKDLADKEKKELGILEKYLPEQLSTEKVKKIVEEAIEKTGAKEIREMGKVMQEIMPKLKGRADNSLVSKMVKELLVK